MEESWRQLSASRHAPSILTIPNQVLRQAAHVQEHATEYFFWSEEEESDAGFFALAKFGRLWSVVGLSAQGGIQLFKDVCEKPDPCRILRVLTGNPLLLTKGGGCCASGTVDLQKMQRASGSAAMQQFTERFIHEQKIHKYGIVFLLKNDEQEEQFFARLAEEETEEFKLFVKRFGSPRLATELKEAGLYTGDLPLRGKPCSALYLQIQDHENVGHLATLLPFNPNDEQQLERKKHIGNDTVVVVFRQRGFGALFEPDDFIVSHFVRIYLVFDLVQAYKGDGKSVTDIEVELSVYYRIINPEFLVYRTTRGRMNDPEFLQELHVLVINACLSAYSEARAKERRALGRVAAFREQVKGGAK